MSGTPPFSCQPKALAALDPSVLAAALAGEGIWLDVGALTLRVQSNSSLFGRQLQAAYPHFGFVPRADWADVHALIHHATGLRHHIRPQIELVCDGQRPFEPFPADTPSSE